MPINAIRKDETLDQLIGRVHGKLPAAQLKVVRAETLAANPHLSVAAPLAAGTVVVVPPLRDGATAGRDASSSADAVKVLDAALASYREQLGQTIDDRRAELTEDAKTLKSARFRKVVDAVPAAVKLVEELDAVTKTRQKDLTESRDLLKKQVEALSGDLQALLGKLP